MSEWTKETPTEPGAYWLHDEVSKGMRHEKAVFIVEVDNDWGGRLTAYIAGVEAGLRVDQIENASWMLVEKPEAPNG